jgi:hypothetical protein
VRNLKRIVNRRQQQTIDSDTASEGSSDGSEFSSDSDSDTTRGGNRKRTTRRRRGGAPIKYDVNDDRRRLTRRNLPRYTDNYNDRYTGNYNDRYPGNYNYNDRYTGNYNDRYTGNYNDRYTGNYNDRYNRYGLDKQVGKIFYITVKLELFPGKTIPLKWQAKLACQSQYERVRENYADMMGLQYLPNELYIPSSETYKKPEMTLPTAEKESYRPYKNAQFDRDWA